jgi:hypothetical protein
VRRQILEIFQVDAEGRIVVEEMYDALVMRQLGAVSI